jgi:hypothetical protein
VCNVLKPCGLGRSALVATGLLGAAARWRDRSSSVRPREQDIRYDRIGAAMTRDVDRLRDDAEWNYSARRETPTARLDRNWDDLLQELRVAQTGEQAAYQSCRAAPGAVPPARAPHVGRGSGNCLRAPVSRRSASRSSASAG